MANALTALLGIAKPSTQGAQQPVLAAGFDLFDQAIAGASSHAMAAADVVLTAAQAAYGIHKLTGTLTTDRNLTFPTQSGKWVIINQCTMAGHTINIKTAAGASIARTTTGAFVVVCDGSGILVLT